MLKAGLRTSAVGSASGVKTSSFRPKLSAVVHRRIVGAQRFVRVEASGGAPEETRPPLPDAAIASLTTWMLTTALPAAAAVDTPVGSPPASSYYVSLGLFVITLPGLWSLIKRAPKAKVKRKTFEVAGPAVEGAVPLDVRAKQIFSYFKNYNYDVKNTGDVITFEGKYKASVSQAAALVLYTFISLGSTALVLSIAAPWAGNWWYTMCLVSPAAGAYYLKNANRTEEFKVKMVTADDDSTTDIVVEGDEEEIDRLRRELGLVEKGMEYVKGILER